MVTAYMLVQQGLKVAVIETGRIIHDVTGYTTGKLTAQHGLFAGALIARHGEKAARAYAEANLAGLRMLSAIVRENEVDCDFKPAPSFVFTEVEQNLKAIETEVEACSRLGLEVEFVDKTPLRFVKGAVRMDNQAQWHPRKFLLWLAEEISASGSYIFESTRALDIRPADRPLVKTEKGDLEAGAVVVTTNLPFFRQSVFNNLLGLTRSYVLGVRLKGEVPEGLFYSVDQYTPSMRHQVVGGGIIFMVGTWNRELPVYRTQQQYEAAESYARDRFDIDSIEYHWFTMDRKTPDLMPVIGRLTGESNIFVATGFGGWGMTTSGVTGMILTDLISGRDNPWSRLFDPARLIEG